MTSKSDHVNKHDFFKPVFKHGHNTDSLASEHFGKDAAGAPDVHRCGITGLQQNLRRSVPQCHHLGDIHITKTKSFNIFLAWL